LKTLKCSRGNRYERDEKKPNYYFLLRLNNNSLKMCRLVTDKTHGQKQTRLTRSRNKRHCTSHTVKRRLSRRPNWTAAAASIPRLPRSSCRAKSLPERAASVSIIVRKRPTLFLPQNVPGLVYMKGGVTRSRRFRNFYNTNRPNKINIILYNTIQYPAEPFENKNKTQYSIKKE